MALDVNKKILDGEGLAAYTRLLRFKFDEEKAALVDGASDEGDTLKKLEDRLANVESTQSDDGDAILTIINEVYGEGGQPEEPSRIDNLEDAVNGITTTTIPGIQDQITALTTSLTTTYKVLQTATTITAPAGSYINSLSQDDQGVITGTTLTFPTASTTTQGMVTMATGATTAVIYDADQVDDKIAEAVASVFKPEVVAADADGLPDVASPEENVIYLVPNGSGTTPNYYIEYMWVDGEPEGHWEVVGNTELTIETLSDDEIERIFNDNFNPIG